MTMVWAHTLADAYHFEGRAAGEGHDAAPMAETHGGGRLRMGTIRR